DREVLVNEQFEHSVEPQLAKSDRPAVVHDYPAALCPLSKREAGHPQIAERFELYVAGMEVANAYTELNDPVTQEATFRQQLAGLPEDESMAKMDEDFVRALRHGMPPAGGLGVGIDRLVMLLTETPTIRDVILCPTVRRHGPRHFGLPITSGWRISSFSEPATPSAWSPRRATPRHSGRPPAKA